MPSSTITTLEDAFLHIGHHDPLREEALLCFVEELWTGRSAQRWKAITQKYLSSPHFSKTTREQAGEDLLQDLLLQLATREEGYTTDNGKAYLSAMIRNRALATIKRAARDAKNRVQTAGEDDARDIIDTLSAEDESWIEYALASEGYETFVEANLGEMSASRQGEWFCDWFEQHVYPLIRRGDTRENVRQGFKELMAIRAGEETQDSLVLANNPGVVSDTPDFDRAKNLLQKQHSRAREYIARELGKLAPEEVGLTEGEHASLLNFVRVARFSRH